MTQRKQWTAQEKLAIVLQGMSGNVKISELCNDHGITQAMYYAWKNLLMSQGTKIFEHGKWLTADPIGFPDGWNNLAYCNNSVIATIDWLGGVIIVVYRDSNDLISGHRWVEVHNNGHMDIAMGFYPSANGWGTPGIVCVGADEQYASQNNKQVLAGEVNVSCYDAEGNFHRKYSTDMRGFYIKANVFFPPDVNVEGGAPSQQKPPCWFVFWKDGNVISGIEDFEYENLSGWGAYYHNSNKLYLRKECRGNGNHRLSINNVNGSFARFIHSEPPTKHLLHVAGTIVHENYHKFVHLNFTGIDSDSDGLPDSEESIPSNYNSVSFIASNPHVANSLNFPNYGGYEDQEVRCRIVETDAPASQDLTKDWSATNDNPLW